MPLRLGTRGSKLARWQAEHIAARCAELGTQVEIIEIATTGDRDQSTDLAGIGSVGLFTKELQRALLAGQIDFAVHSLKDLPTTPVAGLTIAAVPERENPHDALVSPRAASLKNLPDGALIGTGSTRRVAQLLAMNPTWRCEPIRGNVDTRLRKLDEGQYDALVLAAAGLIRLGLAERITKYLSLDQMSPAPGQGALGIECRVDDTRTITTLAPLNDAVARGCVTAERALLGRLDGGCLAAIGAHATVADGQLNLQASVLHPQGLSMLAVNLSCAWGDLDMQSASELGLLCAERLLAIGAAKLLAAGPRRLS